MESAPRRAALRDGLRLATGNRRLRCGCRQLIHETRPKVRASSTLDLVRSAITMNLGSMAIGVSREWMSTPAKKRTHGIINRHRTGGTRRRPSSARPMRSTADVAVLHGVKRASPLETFCSSDQRLTGNNRIDQKTLP